MPSRLILWVARPAAAGRVPAAGAVSESSTPYVACNYDGMPAGEVAKALGYRGTSSITRAVARVQPRNERLKHTAAKLERLERKLH